MSDQFALGLLAQIVEQLQQRVDALELRLEELEATAGEGEVGRYLDGSRV